MTLAAKALNLIAGFCLIAPCAFVHAQETAAPPKMQLPADARAYTAARKLLDTAQRLAALRGFIKEYPKSARVPGAQRRIFDLLMAQPTQNPAEIDTLVKLIVDNTDEAVLRWFAEVSLASDLAKVDAELPAAERLIDDVLKHLTEKDFDREDSALFTKAKMPPPSSTELHNWFFNYRALALSVQAKIRFRQGRTAEAATLADQAFRLDPAVDDVNAIRGEIALRQHRDADALESFERAQLYGGLEPSLQASMMALYRAANHGSDADFVTATDARYIRLFPAPFSPVRKTAPADGHTVLLELFTGSGCTPCVGADLALDGVLAAYSRAEVVALSFDQHIPAPDPLANPDSVARGTQYDIRGTPTIALDGVITSADWGGERKDSEKIYLDLSRMIDKQAAHPSGVHLALTVDRTPTGLLSAHAAVTLPGAAQLQEQLTPDPDPAPPATPAATPKVGQAQPAALPVKPRLTVNFALVEDDIRYAGENGIRFHRMVVRALAAPAEEGLPVTEAPLNATFDLSAISQKLSSYLDAFEQGKEQGDNHFESVHFLSRDTRIEPGHLSIAAWVQDLVTHRVLQSAILPVPATLAGGTGAAN